MGFLSVIKNCRVYCNTGSHQPTQNPVAEEEEEQYEHVEPPPSYPHDEEQFQRLFSEIGGIEVETLIVAIRAVAAEITHLKQQLTATTPPDHSLQDALLASVRAANDLKACYERALADGRRWRAMKPCFWMNIDCHSHGIRCRITYILQRWPTGGADQRHPRKDKWRFKRTQLEYLSGLAVRRRC